MLKRDNTPAIDISTENRMISGSRELSNSAAMVDRAGPAGSPVQERKLAGFDSHMRGEGMIVEHCDDNLTNNSDENHYLVDVEQADGQRDLNLNANRGDATDPFPTATNSKFTVSSNPNSKAYDGSDSRYR